MAGFETKRSEKQGQPRKKSNKRLALVIVVVVAAAAAVCVLIFLNPFGGNPAAPEESPAASAQQTASVEPTPEVSETAAETPPVEIPSALLEELESDAAQDGIKPQDGVTADYQEALQDPDGNVNKHVEFTGTLLADSVNNQGMLSLNVSVDGAYYAFVTYVDMDQVMNFKKGDQVAVTGFVTGAATVQDESGTQQPGAMIAADTITKEANETAGE